MKTCSFEPSSSLFFETPTRAGATGGLSGVPGEIAEEEAYGTFSS